jgi:2-dehydro-3-deoxyphosphogluconate aldolase / (4S)-4-hydroxy-2-oxoglutarate aldolase
MRFMPTGGVREADLREYLGMPSVVACGGSWLAPPELISAADYAEIERRVAAAVSIARSVRAPGTSTV